MDLAIICLFNLALFVLGIGLGGLIENKRLRLSHLGSRVEMLETTTQEIVQITSEPPPIPKRKEDTPINFTYEEDFAGVTQKLPIIK